MYETYREALLESDTLRPCKSVTRDVEVTVERFSTHYKNNQKTILDDSDILKICNATTINDTTNTNVRVMREFGFIRIVETGIYEITPKFISYMNDNDNPGLFVLNMMYSISGKDDIRMYSNLMLCTLREGYKYGKIIAFPDSDEKFKFIVKDPNKRYEYRKRVYDIYGFSGRNKTPEDDVYTPNANYRVLTTAKNLNLIESSVLENGLNTYKLTTNGIHLLQKIDENLKQKSTIKTKYDFTEGNATNKIFYGVPGCGKSHYIENKKLHELKVKEENRIRTTFYQDYSNTDFVGQILPKVSGEKVEYIFNPGPFTLALIKAHKKPEEKVALIVEEINRGNAPAIFGDIFQLLDRKNGVSEYGIKNVQVLDYLNGYNFGEDGEELYYHFDEIKIPGNLYIYATMNTSDQNVYTLDTAFTRRWDKAKIPNEFTNENDKHYFKKRYVPGTNVLWKTFADAINNHITQNLDNLQVNEDKQLGAYFIKDNSLSVEAEVGKRTKIDDDMLKANFAHKVLDYLWSDVSKFDHSIIFKSKTKDNKEISTLDALIDEFKKNGKSIFQESILKYMPDNSIDVAEESDVTENTNESVGING